MSVVAKALDIIQSETKGHLDISPLTIAATISKLRELKSKELQYFDCLVDALLEEISKRYDKCLEDQDCHPTFRLYWHSILHFGFTGLLATSDPFFYTNSYIRVKSVMQEAVFKDINFPVSMNKI